ncbi:MAG: SRPBCC family protein [Myxococcales bacterium]
MLRATQARVWQALTDSKEFGAWFRVSLEGPFVVGQKVKGHITYPGYEHLKMEVVVEKMEAQRLFSYRWHPYAIDPKVDYASETPTLVEFKLEERPGGTLLTVVESGFDQVPAARRAEAFRMNDGGWATQLKNIEQYVAPG